VSAADRPVDCIVVGGGAIGLSTAFELLRRGRSVRVLGRDAPGCGATAAAAGMLAPASEVEHEGPALLDFRRESLARYAGFVEAVERHSGLSCRYRDDGTLWVAVRREHRGELERLGAWLEDLGLPAVELSGAEACALEPHLTGRVLGALRVDGDHQVDPRCLAAALARAIERLGGSIGRGMSVEDVEDGGGMLRVRGRGRDGDPFEERAARVVLAAGAWSGSSVRARSGVRGPRPVKGQLVRLRGPALLRRVVRTPHVYLVPREGGELLVGGTVEELGFDTTPTAGAVMDLLRHAWEAVPATYDAALAEVSVGLRSAVDDHLPVIGESEQPGLFLAWGHFRNGILLAPATAHYLAEWIAGGTRPAALAPFAPSRLARRENVVRE
jgi:glycine oxidase